LKTCWKGEEGNDTSAEKISIKKKVATFVVVKKKVMGLRRELKSREKGSKCGIVRCSAKRCPGKESGEEVKPLYDKKAKKNGWGPET